MKTPLLLLLVCWSSLALALGDPYKAQGPDLPHSLQGKHAPVSPLSMGQSTTPQSTLRTTTQQGYSPWVEQATGLPSGTGVNWIHAVDSNVVWATVWGETQAAVILTTNGGTTWACDTIKIALANLRISGIFALDASRCWVTMFDNNYVQSGGLFRTTDGGATWTQDPTAFRTTGGFADFLHFFDANNGVAVGDPQNGYFEIYTTSNGGNSWSRVPQANIPPKLIQEYGIDWAFSAAGNSLWFPTSDDEGGTGRYYKTTDRGLTWSVHVYPGASPTYIPMLGFQDDNVGLGNGSFGEVSRTTDGGTNWARVSSPSHLGFGPIEHIPGTSGMYVAWGNAWQYPTLEGGYIIGTAYSTDGGASWTRACAQNDYYLSDFASASAGWSQGPGSDIYKWTMAQGRVIGISVDSLKFVTRLAGKISDTIAVDAVNFGSDPLTVSGIVAPGNQFTVVTQPTFPALIPPLGSVRVSLGFTPHSNGLLKDSLVFVSNASNAPRTTVYLQGTGYGATAVEPTPETPKAFALLQNYPNPFNPATNIQFSIVNRQLTIVKVYDALGEGSGDAGERGEGTRNVHCQVRRFESRKRGVLLPTTGGRFHPIEETRFVEVSFGSVRDSAGCRVLLQHRVTRRPAGSCDSSLSCFHQGNTCMEVIMRDLRTLQPTATIPVPRAGQAA